MQAAEIKCASLKHRCHHDHMQICQKRDCSLVSLQRLHMVEYGVRTEGLVLMAEMNYASLFLPNSTCVYQ